MAKKTAKAPAKQKPKDQPQAVIGLTTKELHREPQQQPHIQPPTPREPTSMPPQLALRVASTSTRQQLPSPSDRVRAEWKRFEGWLAPQQTTLADKRAQRLDALRDDYDRQLHSNPRGLHTFLTQQYETQLVRAQTDVLPEEELAMRARVEWEERLQQAGLQAEDWTDITPEEMEAVSLALGGHLEDDADDDITVGFPGALPLGVSPFANIPTTAELPTAGQRLPASYNFATAADNIPRKNPLTATRANVNAWQMQTMSYDMGPEDENTHPHAIPVRDTLSNKRASTELSFARPRGSSIVERTAPAPPPAPSTRAPPQDPSRQSSQDPSKSRAARAEYVGPVLLDPDRTPEEAEFEAFKWATRRRKIEEFHAAASTAEIRVAWTLRDAALGDAAVDALLAGHARDMQELRKVKENERKAAVDTERAKMRAEMRRRSALEHDTAVSTVSSTVQFPSAPATSAELESFTRVPVGSRARRPSVAQSAAPPLLAKQPSSTASSWSSSPPKADPMSIDHEIWLPTSKPKPESAAQPVQPPASAPSGISRTRQRKASLLNSDFRDEPAETPLPQTAQEPPKAHAVVTPRQPPTPAAAGKTKTPSAAGRANQGRKKGRGVQIEEVPDDEDAAVPPPPAPAADNAALRIQISDMDDDRSTLRTSSPIIAYAAEFAGATRAGGPKPALKPPARQSGGSASGTPSLSNTPSLSSTPTDEGSDFWENMVGASAGASTDALGAEKHVRWTPSVLHDSDADSVMSAGFGGEFSAGELGAMFFGVAAPEANGAGAGTFDRFDDDAFSPPVSLPPRQEGGFIASMPGAFHGKPPAPVAPAAWAPADSGKRKRKPSVVKDGRRRTAVAQISLLDGDGSDGDGGSQDTVEAYRRGLDEALR